MMEDLDTVSRYGLALGWNLKPKTVLVEGTSDVAFFQLAASLELEASGINLMGDELAIVAAGVGDRGGTRGVIRELVCLRGIAQTTLLASGKPKYRFIGLFDNDKAGRQAVKFSRDLDSSILECKDVFRLQPEMPTSGNLDPKTLQKTFEKRNSKYKGLNWELEDLLPQEFLEAFFSEYSGAIAHKASNGGRIHHDLTYDGKARLHRFVKENAVRDDLGGVIEVLKAIRFYMCLPPALGGSD